MKYIYFYLILLFFNLGFLRAIDILDNNSVLDNSDNGYIADIPNTDNDTGILDNDDSGGPIISAIENKEKITINGIAYIYDIKIQAFDTIVKAYNKYSDDNNLGINLNVEIYTSSNATTEYEDFGSHLETLFNSKNGKKKYDLIFYFDTYTPKLGHQFVDLKEYIDQSHIDLFEKSLVDNSCIYDGNLIGLPVFFDTNVLYSNNVLLKKYNKSIPKTWDQLIDTAVYIRDQEREIGNTDLDPFLGLFSANNDGAFSMYEVTTSFRNSNEDPFPDETTESFREGVQTLKRIKDNLLNSVELFEADLNYAIRKFNSGNVLFLKFYMGSYPPIYEPSALPGKKEGVSGSIPGVFIISLNRYIVDDEVKKNAAINAIKFFTSKETQKEYILKQNVFSAITDLYYDPEVCQSFKCDVYLNSKPFTKLLVRYPESGMDKFRYIERVRKYVVDYLFDKTSLDTAMKNIKDLTKVYHLTVFPNDSVIGLIFYLIYILLLILMIVSVSVIMKKSKKTKYKYFLTDDFWILSIFGTAIMMSSMLSMYGSLTSFKCQLRIALASIGFCMVLIPILNKLIVNFPTHNKVSLWFDKVRNKYLFFIGSLILIAFINSLLNGGTYILKHVDGSNGQKFETCSMQNGFGKFVLAILCLLVCLLLLSILLLVFIEWNYRETLAEMKVICALLFVEVLAIILLITHSTLNFNNYIIYAVLFCGIALFFSLSNFVCVFVLKLIPILKNEKEESVYDVMNKIHQHQGVYPSSKTKTNPLTTVDISNLRSNNTTTNIAPSYSNGYSNVRSQTDSQNDYTSYGPNAGHPGSNNKSSTELNNYYGSNESHPGSNNKSFTEPNNYYGPNNSHHSKSGDEPQNVSQISSTVGSTHTGSSMIGISTIGTSTVGASTIGSRSSKERKINTLIKYHYKSSKD